MRILVKVVLFLAVAVAAEAIPAVAQAPKPNFNRVRSVDVEHYSIGVSFDRKSKSIRGDTTVTFKPLADGLTELRLDAVGLAIESVSLEPEGRSLSFRTSPDQVIVELGGKFATTDSLRVRFRYSAKPKKGVYFIDAKRDRFGLVNGAQIWTQGEPEEARHWFPSYDFPDDKATTEQFITVGSDETAIGNGELIGITRSGRSRTFHYRMPVPHSVYLVSFVVGNYVRLDDRYRDIPLSVYTYPGREETAARAFLPTKEMMRFFEDVTGINYPYPKYDQTIVADFNFGGMENITATTFSDLDIFLVDEDFGKNIVEDLVAHELAHSWFGNLVTCRNWAELWLNESFATFMEAAYRERRYGRSDYLRKIREDAEEYFAFESRYKKKRGLFNQLAKPDDSIFDAITYQKGAVVLHMLRTEIGEDAFWKSVRVYLDRYKWKNVESKDLLAVFEEVSGRELDRFFGQWVFGARHPVIRYSRKFDESTKTYTLTVNQVQTVDEYSPAPFVFEIEVDFQVGRNRRTETLKIDEFNETFTFSFDATPGKPVFDPQHKVPLVQVRAGGGQ